MNDQIREAVSYRAFLRPAGHPTDTGVLPFIQLRAVSAEHAMRAAHHVTGHPVDSVERLDAAAA
ncbi:MAG: hypothetical protein EOP35_05135 [Rubrivivax sp.]|nr:MAG: hypothetical protein EOP35_05135 [Rubrivivax sp.]